MGWSALSLGTGTGTKTAGASISFNTTTAVDTGDWVVLAVACDNLSGTTPTVSVVNLPTGTWSTPVVVHTGSANATAAAGVQVIGVAVENLGSTISSGATFGVTLSASVAAKAIQGIKMMGGLGVDPNSSSQSGTTTIAAGGAISNPSGSGNYASVEIRGIEDNSNPSGLFTGTLLNGVGANSSGSGAATNVGVALAARAHQGTGLGNQSSWTPSLDCGRITFVFGNEDPGSTPVSGSESNSLTITEGSSIVATTVLFEKVAYDPEPLKTLNLTFEDGLNTYSKTAGTTLTNVTSPAPFAGTRSLKVQVTSADLDNWAEFTSSFSEAPLANTTYRFSAAVYIPSTLDKATHFHSNVSSNGLIWFWHSTGGLVFLDPNWGIRDEWQIVRGSTTTVAAGVWQMRFYGSSNAVSDGVLLDNVVVSREPTIPADQMRLIATETANIVNAPTASDTAAITVTDTSAITKSFASTDSAAITITEATSLTGKTATDAAAITVTDTSSLSISKTATDGAAITATDVSVLTKGMPGAETPAIAVTEASTILVTFSASETNSLTITEDQSISGASTTVSATDTAAVSVSEAVATDKSSTRTDTAAITVTETAAVAKSSTTTDTAALTVTESRTIVVTLEGSDGNGLTVTDISAATVTAVASESNAITLTDTANVNQGGNPVGNESTAISVAETTALSKTGMASTDQGALVVTETATIFRALTATESNSLAVNDISNIASSIPGAETTAVAVTESRTILVTQTRTETAAITVTATSALFITKTATDAAAITITDSSSVGGLFQKSATDAATISLTDTGVKELVVEVFSDVEVTHVAAPSVEAVHVTVNIDVVQQNSDTREVLDIYV